jgi:hypothetical protein
MRHDFCHVVGIPVPARSTPTTCCQEREFADQRQRTGMARFERRDRAVENCAEAVGKLSNARAVATPAAWEVLSYKPLKDAAERMKIPLRLEPLQPPINEAEYRRVFDAMQRHHVDGAFIDPGPESFTHRYLLGRLARQYRLPNITYLYRSKSSDEVFGIHKSVDHRPSLMSR